MQHGTSELITMNDPITPDHLSAFADGELDSASTMRLLELMASDPGLARQALDAQKFKQAVGRSMQMQVPPMPADLQARITQIAQSVDADHDQPSQPSAPLAFPPQPTTAATPPPRPPSQGPLWFIGRWSPAAIAAMLLIATLVARIVPASTAEVFDPDRHLAYPGIIPVSQVDRFASRHVRCLDQIESLRETTKFPEKVELLPLSVEQVVGCRPGPTLDLSTLGYTFWKAGECGIPQNKAVHLIYRALPDTGRQDSLSLWMVRDDGQLSIEEGQTYLATPESAVHPVIVWRDGGMVYYLVGDAMPLVRNVADQLATRK